MATIRKELDIEAPAEHVWKALADFYAVHTRVAPGFLTALEAEDGARVVTFANGSVAREILVDCDHEHRRLVYTIPSARLTAHSASFQVFPRGDGACHVTWLTDMLPNDMAPYIDGQMSEGVKVMGETLAAKPGG
ncbi:MAG TPA: SRPBCC family protein [Phenylobacterium sp.]|nr:SRPBCC family protein [Phenylobacterium sp.]